MKVPGIRLWCVKCVFCTELEKQRPPSRSKRLRLWDFGGSVLLVTKFFFFFFFGHSTFLSFTKKEIIDTYKYVFKVLQDCSCLFNC